MLVEQDDLASATEPASSKLIHGGCAYLEHYEFKLVREALRGARSAGCASARTSCGPSISSCPNERQPASALDDPHRLWLYDHLAAARRCRIQGAHVPARGIQRRLEGRFPQGLRLFRLPVDDARLVIVNAMSAREKGAQSPHPHALPGRPAATASVERVEIEDLSPPACTAPFARAAS
jgi:glycerol-3-phosphate dehydrogenase